MTSPVEDPRDGLAREQVARDELAMRVAAAVAVTPGVAGLHGGIFGAIASYLPGRRLIGVRVGKAGEPVEVGVVAQLGHPIPDTVRAVRRAVAGIVAPGTDVDITVADIATDPLVAAPIDADPIDADPAVPEASVVVDGTTASSTPRRRVL